MPIAAFLIALLVVFQSSRQVARLKQQLAPALFRRYLVASFVELAVIAIFISASVIVALGLREHESWLIADLLASLIGGILGSIYVHRHLLSTADRAAIHKALE